MQNRIDKYLAKNETTLYKMSQDTGIDINGLYSYKNGKRTPSMETAMIMAAYLNEKVSDIWFMTEDEVIAVVKKRLKRRRKLLKKRAGEIAAE